MCRAFLVWSMCTTTVAAFLVLAGFWKFRFVLSSLTSASSVGVTAQAAAEDMDFICDAVASSALHISRAVARVRSVCL